MRRTTIPLVAGLAGVLTITGAMLPWLTLLAGLERFPGTTGVYGRLLLAGGLVLLLLAAAGLRVRDDRLRWGTGLLGGLLLFPAGLGLVGLRSIDAMDPLLVPAAGAGPYVAGVGASIAFAALFLRPASGLVTADPGQPEATGTRATDPAHRPDTAIGTLRW